MGCGEGERTSSQASGGGQRRAGRGGGEAVKEGRGASGRSELANFFVRILPEAKLPKTHNGLHTNTLVQ